MFCRKVLIRRGDFLESFEGVELDECPSYIVLALSLCRW